MKQLTLRLPDDLYEQIRREAEQLGISMKDLILLVLNSYCVSRGIPGLPPVFLSKVA